MGIEADEVLDLLDRHINNDPLTMLPPLMFQLWSHFFPADTRLTVFRSADHWAVFVEIVCFRPGAEDSSLETWACGNCLSEPVLLWYDTPYQFCPATDEDGEDTSYPNTPFAFCIVWGRERLEFAPSPEEYAELGVVIDPDSLGYGDRIGAHVLRFLCDRLGHPFFAPEADLRQLLEENWQEGEAPRTDEMAMLWQTQRWRHPAIVGEDTDGERPSRLPYFQALARAIASGDVAELECQNPADFNTDWRIWDALEREQERELVAGQQAMRARQEEAWGQLSPETQEELRALGGSVIISVQMVDHPK